MGKKGPRRSESKPDAKSESKYQPSDGVTDPLVSDPRFNAASWDPRFSRVPKRAKNAVADDRFTTILKRDPSFREKQTPVDRYGRPKKRVKLDYTMQTLAESDGEGSDDSHQSSADDDHAHGLDVEGVPVMSVGDEDGDSDEDFDDLADLEEFEVNEEPLENIPRGEATSRLAVVGLNWSVTRAVDILASLNCFCPTGKKILFVEVHPSKFGLERLEIEAKLGPQVVPEDDLRVVQDAKELQTQDLDGENGDSNENLHSKPCLAESEGRSESEDENDNEEIVDNAGNGDDYDDREDKDDAPLFEDDAEVSERVRKQQAALRKYEEDRLKYYYAVVKCEDIKTADSLYEQCDGVEYSQTGQSFDLRFIPDDMEITTKPRDRAESVPDGYAPPAVNLSSLNNSTVKLSWDADDPDRVILKKKAFSKHELYDQDLKAYLASSSEDEGQEEEQGKEDAEQKRSILLGAMNGDDAEEEDEAELEVTFEPGMLEKGEEILKRKLERDEREGETPWEGRMRRLRERKQERRRERRAAIAKLTGKAANNDDESDVSDESSSEEPSVLDPLFSGSKDPESVPVLKEGTSMSRRMNQRDARGGGPPEEGNGFKQQKGAELEPLTTNDGETAGKTIREKLAEADSDEEEMRRQRKKGKTRGKRRWQKDKSEVKATENESLIEASDDRFQGVFNSHLFAIDPTHPKYRDDGTTRKIMKEKVHRSRIAQNVNGAGDDDGSTLGSKDQAVGKVKEPKKSVSSAQAELKQLAARVKARAEKRKKRAKG